MPDNVLRIATEVDLTGLTGFKEGAEAAGAAAARMAKQFVESGLSAKDAGEALKSLGFTAKDTAAAMASLAGAEVEVAAATEAATVPMSGLERATAQAGGRILGMEAGLGMAGGAIGRIAAQLPGLGTVFAIAFPLALIDFAVEKIEAFRLGIEKADREVAEFAIDSDKAAESIELENLKLEDQIQKFEHRPAQNMVREAILETKMEAESLSKSLDETIQKMASLFTVGAIGQLFSKATGDEAGALERIQPILNQITEQRLKLAEAPAGSDASKAAVQSQIDLYKELNHQIDLEILNMEAAGERNGKFIDADSIAKLQNFKIGVEQSAIALSDLHKEAGLKVQVAGLEQEAADPRKKAYEQWEEEQTRAQIRASESWKKFLAERVEEERKALEEGARIEAAGQAQMSEQLDRAGERLTEIDITNAKTDAAGVEQALEGIRLSREKLQASGNTGFFPTMREDNAELQTLNTEMGAVSITIERLQEDIKRLSAQPFLSETDEKDIQKYNQELATQEQLLNKLKIQYEGTAQKIEQMWKQLSKTIAQDFTQAVNSVLTGHEKIGQAAVKLGQELELYIIDKGIKMVVTKYGTELLEMLAAHSAFLAHLLGIQIAGAATQKAAATTAAVGQITTDAAVGFAAAFASVIEALPFPANVTAAPAVAAGVSASILSSIGGVVAGTAERGAVVPQDMPIFAHANEMILPAHLSGGIQQMIANGSSTSSSRFHQENHFHKTSDMSESAIARITKRAARRGMFPGMGR